MSEADDSAEHRAAIEEGLAAVREWEAVHGAFTEDELAEADRRLHRALANRDASAIRPDA